MSPMAIPNHLNQISRLDILDCTKLRTFSVPVKKISELHDVSTFLVSHAYSDIMKFLLQLNYAMFPQYTRAIGKETLEVQVWDTDMKTLPFSETVRNLRKLLGNIEKIIEEAPPDPGPRRFGNVSFRKWFEIVENQSSVLLERHLPLDTLTVNGASDLTAHVELSSYLLGSFGSSQRLDYGTGHELSFLAFLGCIWKLGGFKDTRSGNEERAIVLGVIEPYLHLVRKLIKTYTLEPAGSHGVWGLDDHSFLPYIFGSAQYSPAISNNDELPTEGSYEDAPSPADIVKAAVVQRERSKNMYFGAIGFIYDVKKGPFWEHSPILYDISGVPAGWAKINKGMIKMYNAEVLSKFPVVQHFRFGSLFSWDRDPNAVPPPASVHTSTKPSQASFNPSSRSAAEMRMPPPETTVMPRPIAQPATPTSMPATTAPWAKAPAPLIAPGRFPAPRLAGTEAPSDNGRPGTQSMPPSTQAPWAKPKS